MSSFEDRAGRWGAGFLAVALGLAFPLAWVLPPETGWENGLFEMTQNVLLLGAALLSVWQASQVRRPSHRALLLMAALIWAIFMGREMSWGAIFLQPSSVSDTAGPIWSSRVLLWYRPAVPHVVGAVLLVALSLGARHRAWQAFGVLNARKRWPVAALVLFVLAFVLASQAEGKGEVYLEAFYGTHAVVLEEVFETLGYLALLLAQAQVFWALRAEDAKAI